MNTFKGDISVDGMKLCVENSDSVQLARCLIIANALSNALMSEFVDNISADYDGNDVLNVAIKPDCSQYAPAIGYIAKRARGHEVKIVQYFKNNVDK